MACAIIALQSGPEDRGLRRDVDELRVARREPPPVRDECGHRAFGCRVVPGLRHGDAHRAPVGVAVERHHAAHRGEGQIGRQVVRVRPVLSERGGGDVHQAWVDGAQRLEAEAARGHRARCLVLEEKVGAGNQAQKVRAAGFAIEVEGDAAFAAVEDVEAQALQAIRQRRIQWGGMARRAFARRLHFDHIGAEPRENERAQLGARVRQIQHAVGAQHGDLALSWASGACEGKSAWKPDAVFDRFLGHTRSPIGSCESKIGAGSNHVKGSTIQRKSSTLQADVVVRPHFRCRK